MTIELNGAIELQCVFDFASFLGDRSIGAVEIGPDQEAIILLVDPRQIGTPFIKDERTGWAEFKHIPHRVPYPAKIVRGGAESVKAEYDLEIEASYPIIQVVNNDWLLVASSRYSSEGVGREQNAVLYDQYGQIERRLNFGNGIQSIQTSANQAIWVSYFDEGVYGGNSPNLREHGLQCFDIDGKSIWFFVPPTGFEAISDCYAMNVCTDAVWACYYADFPLVRIDAEFKVQGWRNKFVGARAIAVDAQRVLLWGGYSTDRYRCIVQTIDGDNLVAPIELELRLPDSEISDAKYVLGRGSILHFFCGTCWYQFDLANLP